MAKEILFEKPFDNADIIVCKSEPGFLLKVIEYKGTTFKGEVVQFPENPIKFKNEGRRYHLPKLKVGDVRLFETFDFQFDLQESRNFILNQLIDKNVIS